MRSDGGETELRAFERLYGHCERLHVLPLSVVLPVDRHRYVYVGDYRRADIDVNRCVYQKGKKTRFFAFGVYMWRGRDNAER
jgi:hypothetical protein